MNTIAATSSSLTRMSRIASSSSRASCSGQNAAPCADHRVGGRRRRRIGAAQRDGGEALAAIELDRRRYRSRRRRPMRLRSSGVSAMPLRRGRPVRLRREFPGARRHRLVELGARHHLVDQPPVDRALALDAFLGGAEHVGMVAPHLALVGDAGEAAGAGQHREQRQLGQRHRRRAVVDQHDVVGGERELVAAARRGAVHDADGAAGRNARSHPRCRCASRW